MKKLAITFARGVLLWLCLAGGANASFVGAFAPSTWGWNSSSFQHCCLSWHEDDAFTLSAPGTFVNSRIWHLSESPADISFDWEFAFPEYAGGSVWFFNGDGWDQHRLADRPSAGSMTLHLEPGFFGFEVWGTGGGELGYSSLTVSNFRVAGGVPEPASLLLAGAGLLMLGAARRRNR